MCGGAGRFSEAFVAPSCWELATHGALPLPSKKPSMSGGPVVPAAIVPWTFAVSASAIESGMSAARCLPGDAGCCCGLVWGPCAPAYMLKGSAETSGPASFPAHQACSLKPTAHARAFHKEGTTNPFSLCKDTNLVNSAHLQLLLELATQ